MTVPAQKYSETTQIKPRDVSEFSTLDGFLAEEGVLEEFRAVAIKEVIAHQLETAMKEGGLTRIAMAKRMQTSPAQLRRLLNPKDGNVTLTTLQRTAEIVGRKVRLDLV